MTQLLQITDKNGKPWGYYADDVDAEAQVAACNADPELAEWAPFTAVPVER